MWLSPMCTLDRRSGAAQQVHSVLSALARRGWEAHAVQMTLFDGREAYPVDQIIGKQYALPNYHGKLFRVPGKHVQHRIFYTKSTDARYLTAPEARSFIAKARQALEEIRPDVVITFGSTVVCKELHRMARNISPSLVFFLANASYDDSKIFEPFDHILVNSHFMRRHYKDKLGIESRVIPEIIQSDAVVGSEEVLSVSSPGARKCCGFVTMVNPSFLKGAPLFARLVLSASRKWPEWTFLAVEGRMTDSEWAQTGLDLARQPNLWWIPNQREMRRVYARTSVLVAPTFGIEAAGRVVVEAQLGGIPVLASNHGGLPEMLNGGGFTFDIPQKFKESWTTVPSEEAVQPWLETLARLMEDDEVYSEACTRAVEASREQHPDRAEELILQRFQDIVEQGRFVQD